MNQRFIQEVECNYDVDRIRAEIVNESLYTPFHRPDTGKMVNGWGFYRPTSGYVYEIAENIAELFNTTTRDISPRAYRQARGYQIRPHRDVGTCCSLNILLTDEQDPIVFYDKDKKPHRFLYRCAVVDVSKYHSVPPVRDTRYLYRVSFFKHSFDEVVRVLSNKLPD